MAQSPSSSSAPLPSSESSQPEAVAPLEDELIGSCFNDTYVIEAVLGEGGMGRVYRAHHSRIPKKMFALKVLHPEHARNADQLARFQREAETSAMMSHPNIVSVFDVGRSAQGHPYIACELLVGVDLDVHLEKVGKLSVESTVRICIQVCDAVDAAHKKNVIHRDLKPQNVFLLSDETGEIPPNPVVKVVDFGLSRFLDHADAQLTKTGALLGSPAFMAPEQAMGHRGDHLVDVYGIGVLLYQCLTGSLPLVRDSLPATLLAVMTEEPPRPRSVNPEIPETLELVVQCAMAKDPNARYPDVAQLRAALLPFRRPERGRAASADESRARMGSMVGIADEQYALQTSRPRLLFLWFLTLVTFLTVISAGLSGLELFTGPIVFTKSEFVLVLLGVAGTLAMPIALGLRYFAKKIWSNSARIIDLVDALQRPLMAAFIAYGASAIIVRFGDEFLSRLSDNTLFLRAPGLGWEGFTWIFPAIALIAGLVTHLQIRLSQNAAGFRRHLVGAPLVALSILCGVGLIYGGLVWRQGHQEELRVRLAEQAKASEKKADQKQPGLQEPSASPGLKEAPLPIKRASDEELAIAIPQGVEGLLPLSEKYPRDPRVLEPLLVAFASLATGYADAMATTKRLLEVAPEMKNSTALLQIVKRAASTPGSASDLALPLLRDHLGAPGLDILFELSNSTGKINERAQEILDQEEVRSLMSPALRVAVDLRAAQTCEERVALLPRARSLGDVRSTPLLALYGKGSKRGCGKWKNLPCPAQCQDNAKEMMDTVVEIQKRAGKTQL